MTTLVGACPMEATAPSPPATLTEPNSLESSTSPSSTISEVLPEPSTVIDQSVPRIAAAAAGVSTVRPSPPRSARAHIAPASRLSTVSSAAPTCLTSSVVFLASLICVLSANSTARCPLALVLSTSPGRRSWLMSMPRQLGRSMNITSSPDLRAITEPAGVAARSNRSAAAGTARPSSEIPVNAASSLRIVPWNSHLARLMRIGNSACQVSVAASAWRRPLRKEPNSMPLQSAGRWFCSRPRPIRSARGRFR